MTIEEQAELIAKLADELRLLIEAGDEYHAAAFKFDPFIINWKRKL